MAYGNTKPYDREHLGVIRKIRLGIGLAVLLALTFIFVLGVTAAADGGMAPDWTRGRPMVYFRLASEYRRGEVVCVRLPDGGAAPRRVVAVAGDTVELRDGVVIINGIAERGNYSFTRTDPAADGPTYPLLLRQGEYFVLSDRRDVLPDSRSFGLVVRRDILGRVLI